MTKLKQLPLSPIRFYPSLTFNETNFQNPDNRLSHDYRFEGVRSYFSALAIPKQWPDGQPGIDFVINAVTAEGTFYARLYDSDDALYKSLIVYARQVVGSDTQYRVFYDGLSGSGIAEGYYTIKLFQTSDDTLLLESEPLFIATFFNYYIPFEYWNFENDFGIITDNTKAKYTGRIMMPLRIYNPEPQFEKEVYKNDPGVLTTLRTTIQRVFNYDSNPVPVHLGEVFQLAWANSEVYLDRIKVNSEESPEAEIVQGTNLKQITGQATFVDFNEEYTREKVETTQVDQVKIWATNNYTSGSIVGDTATITTASVSGFEDVQLQTISHVEDDLFLIKVVLTDNGTSVLPLASLFSVGEQYRLLEWGTNWISYRFRSTGTATFNLGHLDGERAFYTAVVTAYKIILT
jgi:hypothetical protein